MQYSYTAKTSTGSVSTGVLEAKSPAHLQQQLRDKGLFVLDVKSQERRRAGGMTARRLMWRGVAKRDLMALTAQLAIMTRAGIDLAGALESAVGQCNNATLRRALKSVHDEVAGGASISQALNKHVGIFGEAYVASVAAGETAGQLPQVLDRLAKLLRSEIRLKATIRNLMTYPVVLTTVSVAVLFGLVFFVLPQFAGVFDQFDVPLPIMTQILIDVSGELRTRWFIYIPLTLGASIGAVVFRFSEAGKRMFDGMLLNLYVIRDVTRMLLVGRTFQLLGLMLDSGVPLLDGLRMVRASIRNAHFRDMFDAIEREILNGRGMGETMTRFAFVPSSASQMVCTGEKTGTLAMVTRTMGEYYEEEAEAKLREVAAVVEPLVIVVMGVIVAVIVLSVMLPMFDFATFAQKR